MKCIYNGIGQLNNESTFLLHLKCIMFSPAGSGVLVILEPLVKIATSILYEYFKELCHVKHSKS